MLVWWQLVNLLATNKPMTCNEYFLVKVGDVYHVVTLHTLLQYYEYSYTVIEISTQLLWICICYEPMQLFIRWLFCLGLFCFFLIKQSLFRTMHKLHCKMGNKYKMKYSHDKKYNSSILPKLWSKYIFPFFGLVDIYCQIFVL